MPYPNDIADETERDILERAAHLAAVLEDDWCRPHRAENDRDDVMLLVADLLQSHADTGIELHTWRRALDVVVDHLAADPHGSAQLHRLNRSTRFTVVGTWREGRREAIAALPGRRSLDTAVGAWSAQVRAVTAADAARAAVG